jgi:hypothetical protein
LDGTINQCDKSEDEYQNIQRVVGDDCLLASLGLTDADVSTFSKMTKSNGIFQNCPMAVRFFFVLFLLTKRVCNNFISSIFFSFFTALE